jgi:crotonobetainyl-CoA:carnitine CoA-transferase CaiB-like acyl-CoA transferase
MLEGVRVVELGMWVAGPAAAGVLADWGADVIKVESPAGDPMRRLFSLLSGHGQHESPPFDLDNRGKRSVVIDLSNADGLEVMDRLLGTADVFVTNLRPDAVERLGLGPDALRQRFPRLVVANVSGYGREGPDATRPGYDVGGFWARTGVAATLAPDGAAPPSIRGGFGDHVTALATVAGIMAGLYERERTGEGTIVETSLLRTGMYCLGWDLGVQARYGKVAPPTQRTHEMNPMVNRYQAGDGRWFWLLGVEADRHFPSLCRSLGRDELATDERFVDARQRRRNSALLIAILDAEFAALDLDTLTDRFDAHDVWWAPVLSPGEALADPQARAAGAVVEVPAGPGAPAHTAVASPVRFAGDDRELGPRCRPSAATPRPSPTSSATTSGPSPSCGRRACSAERRRATFVERGHAFGEVGLAHHLVQQHPGFVDGRADIAQQVGVELAFRLGQRPTAHAGDQLGGIRLGGAEQLVGGAHPVHQAQGERFFGQHHAARQQQVHGPSGTDQSR